jgi:integrase
MRRGYSIYQRVKGKGPWYITWRDGDGKRRTIRGSTNKNIAHEVGRAKAAESDRVRAGVVNSAEMRAKVAGRQLLAGHLDAWRKVLRHRGNTPAYVELTHNRVETIAREIAITRLADLKPEAVQKMLAGLDTPQSARHYLTALRGFVKWCRQTGKLVEDPLVAVTKPNVAGETFQRYGFSDVELAALLKATEKRQAKTPFRGKDRAMWYRVMAYTGLRKMEAASLKGSSFHLDGDDPHLFVEATYSKRRKLDRVKLRKDFAAMLKAWLKDKGNGHVFPLSAHYGCERIFRADCAAAGIKPSGVVVLGVHSLRRYFITRMVRSGNLAAAQKLARHSTPALTAKYCDLTPEDFDKGLAGLPAV